MASAKRKTSAKRSHKPATKTKPRAKTSAAAAAQATARSGVEWVKSGAAEWQKGAQDWAKQSAKMYQMPFGQNDAAEAAKSATEGMMNFAQQMFDQTKNAGEQFKHASEQFNPASMFQSTKFSTNDAQEKFSRFARESAEQLNKTASTTQHSLNEFMALVRENGEVMIEVTNLSVKVSKELGSEFISYLNKTFAQNVELGKQVTSCRTLNDLFDLSSTFTKTNLDSFFSESVKLSEKLFQTATDLSEPLQDRMNASAERLHKVMSA